MDHDDIIALILGALGFLAGAWTIISKWIEARAEVHKVDHEAQTLEQREQTDAGRLALEIAQELRAQLADQKKAIEELVAEVDRLRSINTAKDLRISELEMMVKDRDQKIADLETEVNDLRSRLEAVEAKRRGPTSPQKGGAHETSNPS